MAKKDFTFEVVKELGTLSEGNGGWKREVNMVSWAGRPPKLDIRDWSEGHERCGKGISLTPEEEYKLWAILHGRQTAREHQEIIENNKEGNDNE